MAPGYLTPQGATFFGFCQVRCLRSLPEVPVPLRPVIVTLANTNIKCIMLLYKYVSFDTAVEIINTSSIGFSCADEMNDPFECTAFGFTEPQGSRSNTGVATGAYKSMLSRCYAILSLTRQLLNSLMWAHYGCGHQGVVIGFDSKLSGLESTTASVIPVQFGDVIYTSTKPVNVSTPGTKELIDIGTNVNGFQSDSYNIMKRGFLYKSLEWGYEEEVRVVKNIKSQNVGYSETGSFKNDSGEWNKINIESLARISHLKKM